jgi:hypothetical protein
VRTKLTQECVPKHAFGRPNTTATNTHACQQQTNNKQQQHAHLETNLSDLEVASNHNERILLAIDLVMNVHLFLEQFSCALLLLLACIVCVFLLKHILLQMPSDPDPVI